MRTRAPARRVATVLVAAGLLFEMAPASAAGEEAPPPELIGTTPIARKINAQDRLRVRGAWGQSVLAGPRFADGFVHYDSLVIAGTSGMVADTPRPIPWSDVEQVETPGNACGTGALVGACIGFAAGAFLGVAAASGGFGAEPADASGGEGAVAVLGGGTLVAVFGAGVGALIGLAIPKWHTAYRRTVGVETTEAVPE